MRELIYWIAGLIFGWFLGSLKKSEVKTEIKTEYIKVPEYIKIPLVERHPLRKPLEDRVWEIFLNDPRTIGFNAVLIAKYSEISETQANEVLQELFFKNKLTRMDAHGLGYIYYRNPEALKTFKCKKCGAENRPKQPNAFGSNYSKSNEDRNL